MVADMGHHLAKKTACCAPDCIIRIAALKSNSIGCMRRVSNPQSKKVNIQTRILESGWIALKPRASSKSDEYGGI
jgi:hypothetical protein